MVSKTNSTTIRPQQKTVQNVVKRYLLTGKIENNARVTRTQKKLTAAQEIVIKGWVDENCKISFQSISNKCMQEFGVMICKSTAANILTGFSYTFKRIHIVLERRNPPETIYSCLQYALKYINLSLRYSDYEIIVWIIGSIGSLSIPAIRSRNILICCAINQLGIILYQSRLSAYNHTSYSCFSQN
ncbi:hypothetical protein HZS_2723 [Henneguya salminicola]|nr:hypothetical protein HZS_2723 [Henneguya salminicola]